MLCILCFKPLHIELEAVRKEYPELFDAKGRYKKKTSRKDRGDGYKDIFRH